MKFTGDICAKNIVWKDNTEMHVCLVTYPQIYPPLLESNKCKSIYTKTEGCNRKLYCYSILISQNTYTRFKVMIPFIKVSRMSDFADPTMEQAQT